MTSELSTRAQKAHDPSSSAVRSQEAATNEKCVLKKAISQENYGHKMDR